MEGILSQVVTQQQAQIANTTAGVEAVKLVSDANAGSIAAHTVEITNLKADMIAMQANQQTALSRAMTVVSPLLSGIALFMVLAKDIYIR